MSSRSTHRDDIDGLRALAVGLVIYYHFGLPGLPGGFVGVDMFFVISGFLISRILASEISRGRLDYRAFYLRRVRRLAPSLLIVMMATIVAAMFILVPADFADLARSSISVLALASNFYFDSHTGYFGGEATTKALLHTWSLSVEAQFYLIWPLLLVTIGRRKRLLMLAGAGSLALAIWAPWSLISGFYSPLSRTYEFAIGATIALALPALPQFVAQLAAPVGLAMVAFAATTIHPNQSYPSALALIPAIGTGLIIIGGPTTWVAKVLQQPLVTAIGRRSYTLYLVHWPAIVLASYARLEPLSAWQKAALLLGVFFVAEAIYRTVEAPMQRTSLNSAAARPMFISLAGACLLVIMLGCSIVLTGGWAWRFPAFLREGDTGVIYQVNSSFGRSDFSPANATRVLVIGDSHQADLFNALNLNAEQLPNVDVRSQRFDDDCFWMLGDMTAPPSFEGSLTEICRTETAAFKSSSRAAQANLVVVSSRWGEAGLEGIAALTDWVTTNTEAQLVILGRTPEFPDVPRMLASTPEMDPAILLASTRLPDPNRINTALEEKAAALGVPFFRKDQWVCPSSDRCDALDPSGRLTIFDYGHWTTAGAAFFGERMIRSDFGEYLSDLSADQSRTTAQ